jgi:membrane-associated protease RseP (regulator of RpoE activity)
VGLGFNIIGGEEEVGIFISVISKEGVAADNGQLRVGDLILEVNGQDMENWSHETAAQALKTAGEEVTLKVVYKPKEFEEFYRRMNIIPEPEIKQLYVRALFSYDSSTDADRPGDGISFSQGDILHILNGSDEEWWQAALVGPTADDGSPALIPSKTRLERRARANSKTVKFGDNENEKRNSSVSSKLRSSFKLKKLGFGKRNSNPVAPGPAGAEQDEPVTDDEGMAFYEPVTLKKRK